MGKIIRRICIATILAIILLPLLVIAYFLNGNVYRKVGSAALKDPKLVYRAVEKFGSEKIVVGIDSMNEMVATEGWLESSDVHYIDLADKMIVGTLFDFGHSFSIEKPSISGIIMSKTIKS